ALRAGMPEVILGEGKTPAQVAQIFSRLAKHGGNILATRTNPQQFAAVKKKAPKAEYRELARAVVLRRERKKYGKGIIAVVSAGTSDIPVAEEAVVTAELMGNDVERLYDVGVAGIHRLLANRGALTRARVVVVCAGMEGALPSVVGGLIGVPVIAVPTSVGYGAAFKGLAALLATLMPDGSPQSVPVWIGREGDRIIVCTGENSLKGKNTRRDPRVALSIVDFNNPYMEAQIRGRAVERRPDPDLKVMDPISRKYV